MIEIAITILSSIVLIVTGLILYGRRYYGSLEKLGIPVIKPYLLFGSDPYGFQKVQHIEDIKRMKQYGYIYGVKTNLIMKYKMKKIFLS